MSVGAWEPANDAAASGAQPEISRELLQRAIEATEKALGIDQAAVPLTEGLSEQDQQASYLMRLPAERWMEESDAWETEGLWLLIQFFTLAEMQLPGWDAGADSPVIPLAKALRQRKTPLSKERLLWIKEHSTNRYLPYGPL